MNAAAIRGCGIAVAVGGITWGAAWSASPSNPAHNSQVEIWASGIFQLGLLAVLAVMWATRATGASRLEPRGAGRRGCRRAPRERLDNPVPR